MNRVDTRERGPAHRLLFGVLTGLLVAFSVWCVVLLWRSHELRRDLDHHLGWVEDLRLLHDDLDRVRDRVQVTADEASNPGGDFLAPHSKRILARGGGAELKVAIQGLRGALDQLRTNLESKASADNLWQAAEAARGAVTTLEGRLLSQVSMLNGRLNDHWRALYALIVASLLLAGSNLGLLHLAHQRRRRLEQAHTEALHQSTQDPLTGVWNRDAILQLLRRELERSIRSQAPLGVILVDVDGFQQVNVLLGEDQGDFILEQLAERFGKFVRPYDTMGRFGGDSFLVVLPVCDDIATGNVADRLREAINERDMEHALGRIRITVSLAFSTVDSEAGTDADLLIHRLQQRIDQLQAEGPGRLAKL